MFKAAEVTKCTLNAQLGELLDLAAQLGVRELDQALALLKYESMRCADLAVDLDRQLSLGSWGPKAPAIPWALSSGVDKYGIWADTFIGLFRYVPLGPFLMGSPDSDSEAFDDETPQREVEISKGFWIGEAPVTDSVYSVNKRLDRAHGSGYPQTNVSWNQAAEWCRRVSNLLNVVVRLPTEAEWECAARAGSEDARYSSDLDAIAHYYENSSSLSRVKQKLPNALGLYDMLGNVWEWCSDWYGPYTANPLDNSSDHEQPGNSGVARVIRGGSWYYDAQFVRAAYRDGDVPDNRGYDLGFRAVIDPIGPHEGVGRVLRGGSWSSSAQDARAAYRIDLSPDIRLDICGFRAVIDSASGEAQDD